MGMLIAIYAGILSVIVTGFALLASWRARTKAPYIVGFLSSLVQSAAAGYLLFKEPKAEWRYCLVSSLLLAIAFIVRLALVRMFPNSVAR